MDVLCYNVHFFLFSDAPTTQIYTLSLHDALPIFVARARAAEPRLRAGVSGPRRRAHLPLRRSEEHTSELQSRQYIVCRLLLEKKKSERTSTKPMTITAIIACGMSGITFFRLEFDP